MAPSRRHRGRNVVGIFWSSFRHNIPYDTLSGTAPTFVPNDRSSRISVLGTNESRKIPLSATMQEVLS